MASLVNKTVDQLPILVSGSDENQLLEQKTDKE